jgi:hypothetical protein
MRTLQYLPRNKHMLAETSQIEEGMEDSIKTILALRWESEESRSRQEDLRVCQRQGEQALRKEAPTAT